MVNFLEVFLKKVAKYQYKYYLAIFIFVFLFTAFMVIGVSKVEFQGDMSEDNPTDLEIYQFNEKVSERFGGQDNILILITLDDSFNFKDLPKDIRNYEIIRYIYNLEKSLSIESSINSVLSVGTYFNSSDITQEIVDETLGDNPLSNQFFGRDYTSSYLIITTDIGGGERRINEITNLVSDKLESFSQPPGTKIAITGNPPVEVTITRLLIEDAIYTILLACIFIFIFLLIVEGGLIRSIVIFIPLLIGLTWTIGTMGWLGIKISMVTAGLGAMLLGLGVEYGVFMLKRYEEERYKGKPIDESLSISVPSVGSAIIGSGFTTTVGFAALMFSILPMLSKLGMSLAIGIMFTFISAVFVSPIAFIITEKMIKYFDKKLFFIFKRHIESKRNDLI
ncbi:MAG: MMPL family transporter [Candidatus Woesearchaeota archaeon]